MQRILVPAGSLTPGELVLREPQQVHHCIRVCRLQPGDAVECFDGEGRRAAGRVVRAGRDAVVLELEPPAEAPATRGRLRILPALIRPSRFEWMLEKLTELGVDEIRPLVTERTTIKPKAGEDRHRLSRWQRIMAEAARQCGTSRVPRLQPAQRFGDALAGLGSGGLRLVPTLEGETAPIRALLDEAARAPEVIVLIGPEGDFTAGEVRQAQEAGFRAVSLGPRVLRAETAAVAVAAVLQSAIA